MIIRSELEVSIRVYTRVLHRMAETLTSEPNP